jgi:2-polyprenyl-6-methoxyphenol hydroxylase-like FAD-dependent oxidoreductase
MTPRTHWPVIIVGAGPTGLTLAGLLARYGLEVLVIERNPQTVQEPRAVSIDDESLRTMQSVGVIDQLVPNLVLGYGSEYFSPAGRRFLKVKPTTLEYGYPRRSAFRQPVLEALLRENLGRAMAMPRRGSRRSWLNSRSRMRAQRCGSARTMRWLSCPAITSLVATAAAAM